MNDEYFSEAWGHEKSGEWKRASRAYCHQAVEELLDSDFVLGDRYHGALASLFSAMSCEIRAENIDMARGLFSLIKPLLENEIEESDTIHRYLAAEWVGDGYLMLQSPAAIDWYKQAREGYDDLSIAARMCYSESDAAILKGEFQKALRHHDMTPPYDANKETDMDFPLRIEYKMDLVEELSTD